MPTRKAARAQPSVDARLDALEVRLSAVEQRTPKKNTPVNQTATEPGAESPELVVLSLLEQKGRAPVAAFGVSGRLLVGGQVQAGARRYADVRFADVAESLRADADTLTQLLGAIASAPRLTILRRLISSDATRSDLLGELRGTSPGQLYHHVRALETAGLLVQPSRGVFRIRPERVVPLISLLSVARLLTADRG